MNCEGLVLIYGQKWIERFQSIRRELQPSALGTKYGVYKKQLFLKFVKAKVLVNSPTIDEVLQR